MTDTQQREAARQFFIGGKTKAVKMKTPGLTGLRF